MSNTQSATLLMKSSPTPEDAGRFRVWADGPEAFSPSRVRGIKHNFQSHPLMQLDELANLAKALYPTKQCRFVERGKSEYDRFDHAAKDPEGRGIDEVFARIEEPGSWIALYNVETHPAYATFLKEVTDTVRPLVDGEQPGMFNVGGFIFISAPPSVTQFHIDRENNFWLQVRGRKTMNVWDPTDRHVVEAKHRDDFIMSGALENVRLREGYLERSHTFDVGPGDGVYFPSTSPHMTRSSPDWTRPGDGVSISIGVVFYTEQTRRAAHVHALNMVMRRFGLSPTEPGESAVLDRLKAPLGRAVIGAKKVVQGYKPMPGI